MLADTYSTPINKVFPRLSKKPITKPFVNHGKKKRTTNDSFVVEKKSKKK